MMAMTLPIMAQGTGEPMLTIWTNRYAMYGEENNVQFSMTTRQGKGDVNITVDFGYGQQPFVITDEELGEDADNEVVTGGALVTGSVSSEGVIRVYGDPSDIDFLDVHGSNVWKIDISRMTSLAILELGHNELKTLSTEGLRYLEYLDVKDNPFDEGMYLGTHNYLKYLNINQMGDHALDHCNGHLNISQYPALAVFMAWDSHCLRTIDTSGCKQLRQLSIDNTGVTTLDLKNNGYLQILNVADCGMSSLDISAQTYLVELYADNQGQESNSRKLSTLDISNNIHLQRLTVAGNNLRELDVTNQYNLITLSASHNHLTKITGIDYEWHQQQKALGLPAGPDELAELDIRFNDFTFATLPMVDPMTFIEYGDQHEMNVEREYGCTEGGKLDLSKQLKREGTTSQVALAWLSRDGFSEDGQLMPGVDFEYDENTNVITFLTAQTDSVQVACFNSYFQDAVLLTTKFLVRSAEDYGKPVELLSLQPAEGVQQMAMSVATREDETIYVDNGNGTRTEHHTTAGVPCTIATSAVGRIRLFGRVACDVIGLTVNNVPLSDIALDKVDRLRNLSITNCGLADIDLGWNYQLSDLNLSGNALETLDLSGVMTVFNKNLLNNINISGNGMTAFNPGMSSLSFLNLDASNNSLSEIDLKSMERLLSLNIAGNNFKEIDLTSNAALQTIDIRNNMFTFATIPATTANMTMAPQKPVKIAGRSFAVNLSSQAVVDDTPTTYTWREASTGNALTEGTDYTINNGKTTFSETLIGKVLYCEMQNAKLPQFTGDNTLRTTEITVTGMPQHVVATFTTPVGDQTAGLSLTSTKPNTYIYIDWGDSDLREYALNDEMFTTFNNDQTIEGAEVKVYSNEASHGNLSVFSISGVTMSGIDVSKMTELYCLTISGAGLESIDISNNLKLGEVNFDNNNLTAVDFTKHTALNWVNVSHNKLTTIPLPANNHIGLFAAAYNNITNIDTKNIASASTVDLAGNQLTEFDLSNIPYLNQLFISQNKLHSLDTEGADYLMVLDISTNYFDLATLPLPRFNAYFYGNQANFDIECVNGKIDLTSQATVDGEATSIYFFDAPIVILYDEEGNPYFTAGEYIEGDDFTITDGIVDFKEDQPVVVAALMNPVFPNLMLYSNPIAVTASTAINDVASDSIIGADGRYYNLSGQRVNASAKGLIINNGKVHIKK